MPLHIAVSLEINVSNHAGLTGVQQSMLLVTADVLHRNSLTSSKTTLPWHVRHRASGHVDQQQQLAKALLEMAVMQALAACFVC